MPRSNLLQRALALAVLVMLPVGFSYSGLATARLYRQLLLEPTGTGRNASIDANLDAVHVPGDEALRAAVAATRWPMDEDVALVTTDSTLSRDQVVQLYFSASYLLYPRRVWLASAPVGRPRHALVVSPSNRLSFLDLQ